MNRTRPVGMLSPWPTCTAALVAVAGFFTVCAAQDETATESAPQPAAKATVPIAAWDVVPYQVIDKPFTIGVVAFHETGCKVMFKFSGGKSPDPTIPPPLTRTERATPTLNPRTGVWELCVTLDPRTVDDGRLEIEAAVTTLEQKREGYVELTPLILYANAGGTLKLGKTVYADCGKGDDAAGDGSADKPFKTIKKALAAAGDGGTIYLKAGRDYSPQGLGGGKKRQYWTTIAAAPGVARDDVEIGPGRPGTDKLRFRNVTLYSDPPKRGYNTILAGENGETIVWLDDCKLYNRKGRWGGGGEAFGNRYVSYVTGGMTTEMDNGPGAVLLRNHKIVKITSDALTNARTAINVEVRDIDPGTTGAHPDWHQSYTGGKDNYKTCIIYNCSGFSCQSQGFFGHNLKDSAFVNCIFHKLPGHALSQYSGHMDHVLWLHCEVPNQSWLWRGDFRADNCYVINGLFNGMQVAEKGNASGVTFLNNHFIDPGRAMGEPKTTGDPLFVDAEKLDFRLKADSPCARTGKPLQCVPADINGKPYDKETPACGCYAVEAAEDSPPQP